MKTVGRRTLEVGKDQYQYGVRINVYVDNSKVAELTPEEARELLRLLTEVAP